MKKIVGIAGVVALILGLTACTLEQETAVARQLGMAASVTWIGIDNPSQSDLGTVKGVVDVIKASIPTNGVSSYYASVYPVIEQYVVKNLQANQQPMAKLGAASLLSGLDLAFAMNPSWKENSAKATAMVYAFCDGAQTGLSLSATDPVRVAATRQCAMRVSNLKLVK